MAKKMQTTILGEVTLKSGRKFAANLGLTFSVDAKTLSSAHVHGFTGMNGSKFMLLGSEIETIEAFEGQIEVEVPDEPVVQVSTDTAKA